MAVQGKEPVDQFTKPHSESKIIRDPKMTASEKILAIIGEDDDEGDEDDDKDKVDQGRQE